MSAQFAVQKALFQAISLLGFTVHDVAPQRPDGGGYPFVEVGAIVFSPMDTKDRNGFDFVARIHVRDDSHNLQPVEMIQGAIYDRLHNAHGDALSIDGYRLIQMRCEMQDVIREAQGQIHGVSEFRGLIETI